MSNHSSVHDQDLESQQTVLHTARNPPRDRWRYIFLILQACQSLTSGADFPNERSLVLTEASSTTPYSVINICATGDDDSELTGIVKNLPPSPEVSLEVHPDGEDDQNCSNIKLQHANIARIVKAKDLRTLRAFGGVQGIAEALDTDLENGIRGNDEDLCSRHIASTPSKRQALGQGFFGFLLKSCNNYIIFLLLLSAALSIGFGIKEEGTRKGWYDGVIIIVVVAILVVVPSIRDFCHKSLRKFLGKQKPSKKREMVVNVFRGGCQQKISITDVVLGDIVVLERGYQVPADGLFTSGEFIELDDGLESIIDDENPFLFYGAKVINGNGRMLVTSVGVNTAWGEMMCRATHAPNKTPLQSDLDKVNTRTQIIGLIIYILILVVLFLRFKLGKENGESELPELKDKPVASKELMDATKRIFMKPSGKLLTILLVGIVEGLPFVVTLAITYWNKKTLSHKAFAQELSACVTMGSVTTICTDKIGGLTLNPMEVDMCWIGEELISGDSVIDPDVLEALCDGIITPILISQSPCSSIDDFLISWASLKLGMKKMEILKQFHTIVQAKEVNSNNERSGVLMRKNGDNETNMCLHWKGNATTILAMCSLYYDSEGTILVMDENKRMDFEQLVEHMHSKHLKTIAFAYKQIDVPMLEENDLILIGLLGLKNTCWRETSKAIEDCRNAGVSIKLVSEDNVSMLKAIADKCGMLIPNSDAVVLKGEEFRNCTDEERINMVDRIAVMGNSLPSDRLLLVKCLKEKGHIVAVVGVKTTETPALKEADVGLAMGTWSTKMARESSDIFIWDGNFSFLVTIVSCGRRAYGNIRKYIQLQLTMTIAGLLITSITAVSLGDAPITTIQLVWAKLIVTVLGGLALLIEPATGKLDKLPVSRVEPLITKVMWRNIVTQSFYQATILVTFVNKGQAILGINEKVSKSMIFNSFVLCQVFNQFNARELEKKNVFMGIHKNHWFWVAVGVTVVLQAAFIEIASILAGSARLNCEQWAVCSLIGMVTWAIDWAGKCTSDFIKDLFIGISTPILVS